MKLHVKEMKMVKPAEKTPRCALWLSDLDLLFPPMYTPIIYFYRSNEASKFFDSGVLKEALSKVLVPFYPLAGRFSHDGNGRVQINCNEDGVLFVEAESSSVVVDDFGDFVATQELGKLMPNVENSAGISSYPLLALQVTYFPCGGASVGVTLEHRVLDGSSLFHFMNSWSRIARGLDLTIPPFLDRTILRPRNPPQIMFEHPEYQLKAPAMKRANSENVDQPCKIVVLKITKEQLDILKANAKEEGQDNSTFAILAGHIWKCTCIARALPKDQETKLFFSSNGRYHSRLQPPLPPGYIGNAIFSAMSVAMAGDIQSKPLSYVASLIHKTLGRLDNNYLRSGIDYLKVHSNTKRYGANDSRSPNLAITSWVGLATHDADFGWGRPFHVGSGRIISEGRVGIFPNAVKDGSLSVNIALQPLHMKVFEKLFYECGRTKFSRNSFKANM